MVIEFGEQVKRNFAVNRRFRRNFMPASDFVEETVKVLLLPINDPLSIICLVRAGCITGRVFLFVSTNNVQGGRCLQLERLR